jgi:hypothetical protein
MHRSRCSVEVGSKACLVLVALAAPSLLFFAGGRSPGWAGSIRIDPDKLYLGSLEKYSRPAVIDGEQVYRRIPAYREVLERKLDRRDPDYYPCLQRANVVFLRALRQVCRAGGYDLVAERGSLRSEEPVPEITEEVLELVEGRKPKAEKPKAEGIPVGRPD